MESKNTRLLLLLMLGAVLVVGQLYVTLPLAPALASRWQITTGQAAWVPLLNSEWMPGRIRLSLSEP